MRPGRRAMRTVALRVLVFALLVFPLALSTAFPTLARLAGGPAAHVCACEVRGGHSTCACPICHDGDPAFRLSEASIRGKCGDDDVVFGGASGLAVIPATFAGFAPASLVATLDAQPPPAPPSVSRAPPVPPPRIASA